MSSVKLKIIDLMCVSSIKMCMILNRATVSVPDVCVQHQDVYDPEQLHLQFLYLMCVPSIQMCMILNSILLNRCSYSICT